ncbi:MAG: chemotaxis protein CheX [Marinoscillum sp.]|jgi:chemotaxis protein CheX|uniref:Chemotaxis protein CheX n=1 Tax=Marinoscillum luteum TaxID=861051 RepID=A0ABW7N9H8_9BACT|nr:chemotaxis protein CheX [Marinoscillum sp. 108]VXD16460.1 Chemotaxis protein CheX [Marinoscillum sp. 108]
MKTSKAEFDATCSLFINSVNNYFRHLTEIDSELNVPYIKQSEGLMLKDYTGMIGISGNRKGFVYISANRIMYEDLIKIFIGIDDPSEEDILDMAGEISNVVAGNVRANLGANFMISVPVVFQGMPSKLKIPEDVSIYVIPIVWNNHEAFVVIGLQ